MALLIAIIATLLVLPAQAEAFQLVLQDQGADPAVLATTASLLGIQTARVVVKTDNPRASLVQSYRAMGLRVQGAIVVKRWTTAGDIRGVLQAWGSDVKTVSIGNEPELNGITSCDYVRLYRRAYRLIRREFPGTKVGFGEFSPGQPLETLKEMLECPGPRLRADYLGHHPYQFWSDPLAPPTTERDWNGWQQPNWIGLGNLSRLKRALVQAKARLSTPGGRPLQIDCTEFQYLLTGRYRISQARAAYLWPRAIRQAKRRCRTLVIYGIGHTGSHSNWGSSSLLDRHGRRLPPFVALADALGRVLPPEDSSGLDERPMDPVVPVVEGAPQ